MFGQTKAEFNNKAQGIIGEFRSPAGCVEYIQTKAHITKGGTSPEARLAGLLCPVREALDVKNMDFNQLLQRDLDDHRVAKDLLPYVLQRRHQGPAFFPPILAVMLPFDANVQTEHFPATSDVARVGDDGAEYLEYLVGNSYKVQRLAHPTRQEPNEIPFGRVFWNEEKARLVVIDGQHRAMAMLAIMRTINSSWRGKGGEKYAPFYEQRVRALLKEAGSAAFDSIEYPVTICWFPELTGATKEPHRAARKLFVDVNEPARKPSDARLILLSDNKLVHIFTREILNQLRSDASATDMPLFAIEYDDPRSGKDATTPVRWSVLTNLTILRTMVQHCVFGPADVIDRSDSVVRPQGRPTIRGSYMLSRGLALESSPAFPEVFDDGTMTMKRSSLGNESFPPGQLPDLIGRFNAIWRPAILTLISKFLPLRAHVRALLSLNTQWVPGEDEGGLAKEALFSGVGAYWTLKDSAKYWREQQASEEEPEERELGKPATVQAWDLIERKRSDFCRIRAEAFLDRKSTDERTIQEVEALYGVVRTYACQLGAMLTIAHIASIAAVEVEKIPSLAEAIVQAWNAALTTGPVKSRDRRLILVNFKNVRSDDKKGQVEPGQPSLNLIDKLDTPDARYFRYFFLELLWSCLESRASIEKFVDPLRFEQSVSTARAAYRTYIYAQTRDSLRALPDYSTNTAALRKKAKDSTDGSLSKAIKHWFGADAEKSFQEWCATQPDPEDRGATRSGNGDDSGADPLES